MLIQRARMLELPIHEVNIAESALLSKSPQDLILYRPTHLGEKRSGFCKKFTISKDL